MEKIKYVSLSKLSLFLDNLKNLFATKEEVNGKADSVHSHDDLYYTESEIDNMEFITINDIDTICGQSIQITNASEVTF